MIDYWSSQSKNVYRLFELVAEEDNDGNVSEEIVSRGDLRWTRNTIVEKYF